MAPTFLLVDGDEADAAQTTKLLQTVEPRCDVLWAASGPAGLALMEDRLVAPSLIFADFAMPGMTVIQFLGSVRGRRWLDGVRVAVLTASAPDKELVTCYRLGACAFVTKPVSRYDLRDVIGEWARPTRALEVDVPRPLFGGMDGFRAC